MSNNMSQAMIILSNIGFSLDSITLPHTMTYKIKHKFKELMFVPIVGIDDNITFMIDTGDRHLITTDGIECKVLKSDVINIINYNDEIVKTYGITWYNFAEIWHKALSGLRMFEFFRIEVEQIN